MATPMSKEEVTLLQEFLKIKRLNFFGEPTGVMCSQTMLSYQTYLEGQNVPRHLAEVPVSAVSHLTGEIQEFIKAGGYKKAEVKKTEAAPVASTTQVAEKPVAEKEEKLAVEVKVATAAQPAQPAQPVKDEKKPTGK